MNKEKIKSTLLEKSEPNSNGCWIWTGVNFTNGYGGIRIDKKLRRVHRVSAFVFMDFDLKSKLYVCHHCDVKNCINPEHLFIGTNSENIQDYYSKPISNEHRKRISERMKNRPQISNEARLVMSEANKGVKNGFYGRKHTEKTREKMRLAKLGKKQSLEHI